MRKFRDESGQVLVMTAFSMVAVLGFVGLATDVGVLFRAQRDLQTAADASATAGALYGSYGQSITNAAQAAATENGVSNGVNGAAVAVNSPPATGPASGLAGFVEVVTSRPVGTTFMSLFGFNSITVTARAVAGPVPGRVCNFLNNTSGADLSLQGKGTVEAPGGVMACGFYSQSSSSDSVTVKGSANFVNVDYIGTAGGLSASGNSNTNPTPVTTNAYAQSPPDSLDINSVLPDPSTMSCTDVSTLGLSTTKVQSTTYYVLTSVNLPSSVPTGGVCFKGNVMLQGTSTVPLIIPAGMYVFTGTGSAGTGEVAIGDYVQANGVTLDINGDGGPASENVLTLTANANSTQLTAPASSTYISTAASRCSAPGGACYDVVIAAPATNTESFNIQWGSSSGTASQCQSGDTANAGALSFSGIIDAPGANVTLQDQGGYALVTGMDVGSLNLNAGLLCLADYATNHPYSPFSDITLVE